MNINKALNIDDVKLIEIKDPERVIALSKKNLRDHCNVFEIAFFLYKNNKLYEIKTDDRIIGFAILYGIDGINKNAGIDVSIDSKEDIRDIKKAMIQLMNYAFTDLLLEKLYAIFNYDDDFKSDFWSSIRFVAGVLVRNHFYFDSKTHHAFTKDILRHEFFRFFDNEKNVELVVNGD